jgi:WD40 repeat protein
MRISEMCVHAVAITPDKSRIVTASEDMRVRVWDITTGDATARAPHAPPRRAAPRRAALRVCCAVCAALLLRAATVRPLCACEPR